MAGKMKDHSDCFVCGDGIMVLVVPASGKYVGKSLCPICWEKAEEDKRVKPQETK